ncbi:hypothetical protein EUGRSUZ_K01188 [Eucalyptus grandis]|uniref:Uncharacterized protein n=2 Tax=Eucalyptus grandis TaxID=71139 RepID=A0ACC3ISI6_EUCGR|nr:hypothetical protein EUGRSUZ_K01188 [Eucalyptus grandis]
MVSFCCLSSSLLSLSFVFLSQFSNFADAQAQDLDYPTATLSTRRTNNGDYILCKSSHSSADQMIVRSILRRGIGAFGTAYVSSFYCNYNCNTCLFAVFIFHPCSSIMTDDASIEVVWSTNRNNPVKINATLELTSKGDLVLKDADGTIAWSTNTSGKSVVGLNLTDLGNLVLFDKNNVTVWQSFDHPTDTLVLGQKLMAGQRLTPSIYYQSLINNPNANYESPYVEFISGSLAFFSNSIQNLSLITVPRASFVQYMKLGSDGHLRVYELSYRPNFILGYMCAVWAEGADLLTMSLAGDCGYPKVCGQYGICSNEKCSCPTSSWGMSYFKQVNYTEPNFGCSKSVPLSCKASQYQSFPELKDVTYFTLTSDLLNIDASSCKEACAKNCSCEAAIFKYIMDPTVGHRHLITRGSSLMKIDKKKNSSHSLDSPPPKEPPNTSVDNRRTNGLVVILGSSLGVLVAIMILIAVIVLFVWKRADNEAKEEYFDQVPGMLTRFRFHHLKAITNDFSKKLGEGGFGSVFEGTLIDGTKVAVKRLGGFGQVNKSFLAEVETNGNIHHVNLVKIVGFCAEKSQRLLIYEFMSKGSLDRWIFPKSNECALDWQRRKKIILDIAKGLNYLHEDCRQKIIHLDIKPQNILLDENFNAKIADFGLSKLIDRDKNQVVTSMRGTPGYMAPEWWNIVITEKVDVYSFGVVILEIVCGRKIFDWSLDEEDMHLLSLFKRKAEEERLLDIVDKSSEDMQLNGPHVVNMMRIAAWCLQGDYTKRPSVSMIIKVLEDVMEVPNDLDYNCSAQPSTNGAAKFGQEFSAATALSPSILSGPR